MFALVDCNNFYCSCERVFNPALNNKPVIVLSNNDGCAIARSEEAKALGIKMASPAHLIADIIQQHNVKVFSSNYTLYGDMSERVMTVLASFVPTIELYSIDEAFLDVSKLVYNDLTDLALQIRKTVRQQTGIPVTVGIAPTKTLAKMANRYAKKMKKEVGVHLLSSKELINEALRFTEIGDVWGIGNEYASFLKKNDIHTAADFVKMPEEWVRAKMTVVGLRLLNELKGIPAIEWELQVPVKKNICSSKSFGKVVTEKRLLQEAIANYAAVCAKKLRIQKSCARKIEVLARTNQFRIKDYQYHPTIVIQVEVATNDTSEIIKYALKGLDIIFKPDINYHKVGVSVLDLVPDTEVQAGLFDLKNRKKRSTIMATLDKINKSFGKDIVRISRQGYERSWKLRAEHLSPCYTTRIDQLYVLRN